MRLIYQKILMGLGIAALIGLVILYCIATYPHNKKYNV